MNSSLIAILLYPYGYQFEAMSFSILILLVIGLVAFGIYKLISWKMNARVKN